MPELKAARPGVVKCRWPANMQSPLLQIPTELQLMILNEVFADLPRPHHDRLWFKDGGWVPPPILQTCYELRVRGMVPFARLSGVYQVHDYNVKDIINRDTWIRDIAQFYKWSESALRLVDESVLELRQLTSTDKATKYDNMMR